MFKTHKILTENFNMNVKFIFIIDYFINIFNKLKT